MNASQRPRLAVVGLTALLALPMACAPPQDVEVPEDSLTIPLDADYWQADEEWRAGRRAKLLAPDGWPTLIGLDWLEDGEYRLGHGPINDIVIDSTGGLRGLPESWATLTVEGGSLLLTPARSVRFGVTQGEETVRTTQAIDLQTDAEGEATQIHLGTVTMFAIERGGEIALRTRDAARANDDNIGPLERFPVIQDWRIKARFEPYPEPRQVQIQNVVDMQYEQTSLGEVVFVRNGVEYRIIALAKSLEDEQMLIVADETNGVETYGAGRYVYVDPPEDGWVELDFNRLYNPPCVFTDYATCPLPPRENRLALRLEGGERHG